jgi:hypothetical protein
MPRRTLRFLNRFAGSARRLASSVRSSRARLRRPALIWQNAANLTAGLNTERGWCLRRTVDTLLVWKSDPDGRRGEVAMPLRPGTVQYANEFPLTACQDFPLVNTF